MTRYTTLLLDLVGVSLVSAKAQPRCQCGGVSLTGSTTCTSGWACTYSNEYYPQCLEGSGSSGSPTTTLVTTTNTTTATPTSTESSGGSNSCGSAPIDGLAGYGADTTGGGSGSGTTVTSCSALSSALAKGGVINVSGSLSGCGVLNLISGTTVVGVGSSSGFTGTGLSLNKVSNVIIRNLKFHDAPKSQDLVRIQHSTKVWVDHCDFSSEGITGDKNYYDGLLDITHACDAITVSWCKFHDHWKGSLVGHSDHNGAEDTGHLTVTYHHNYWNNINSRLPSIRFGNGHIYSSCFENNGDGIHVRMGANVLVEQSYFNNTKKAIYTNNNSGDTGYATQRNNVFVSSNNTIGQGSSYSPPYNYTTDPASCVCSLVKSNAGVGIVG